MVPYANRILATLYFLSLRRVRNRTRRLMLKLVACASMIAAQVSQMTLVLSLSCRLMMTLLLATVGTLMHRTL